MTHFGVIFDPFLGPLFRSRAAGGWERPKRGPKRGPKMTPKWVILTHSGAPFGGPFSALNGIPVRIQPGGVILGVQNDPYRGHSGGSFWAPFQL